MVRTNTLLISLALLFSTISALSFPKIFNREVEKRAITGPHYTIYSDKWVNYGAPPPSSAIPGWNVFAISFWMSQAGAQDMVQGWALLTAAQRAGVKQDYAAASIKLVVTAFGSTDTPTSSGADPTLTATNLANFVKTYSLDGVDVDYEDFYAFNGGTAEAWLITFTRQLRSLLPSSSGYIITHAPVAPWFTNVKLFYPAGGYLYIDQQVGSMIDWYNIQFYNQGDYTDCNSLLHQSSSFPAASVFEIAASGVPLNKIVIGKPANTADASNGYMTPSQLAVCVAQAKQSGWSAGLSVWQYPDQTSDYIQVVWGNAASTGTYAQQSASSTITPVSPTSASVASASAVSTGSSSSNTNCYPISTAQTCGLQAGTRCAAGYCCSSSGYCGGGGINSNDAWCGSGCQSGFGTCYGVPAGTCPASSAPVTSTAAATTSAAVVKSTSTTPVITSTTPAITSAAATSTSAKITSTTAKTTSSPSIVYKSVTTSVTSTTTVTPGAASVTKSTTSAVSLAKTTSSTTSAAIRVASSTSSTTTTTAASAPTSATNCKLAVSSNGTCGGTTGLRCGAGYCCSGSGYCGNSGNGATDPWCGAGCQNTFGTCFGAPASTC